ncbi:MAG: flavin reductase family protein [Ilumatobacteraceae bacterium]
MASFDSPTFRTVLGHFPTGVTIVTGMRDDVPIGFTIGSFTSVSLDPPFVGFLPQVDSETWEALAPAGRFCVNVLHHDQNELCWRFAKLGLDDGRFDGVEWTPSATGCPVLAGSIAWIDCEVERVDEMGDHYFVLGRVVDLANSTEGDHVPLCSSRASSARLRPRAAEVASATNAGEADVPDVPQLDADDIDELDGA